MFSGIVETFGVIEMLSFAEDCLNLSISPVNKFHDLKVGDSIAINGVCLTITDITSKNFNVTVVPETLRKTNLKELSIGSLINLERSIKINDRIHGHCVQGHIDGVGKIIGILQDGKSALLLKIAMPKFLSKYIVKKGYIALDGMSITVIEAERDWFSITLIPHTIKSTIAHKYQLGALINIEVDILSKYIEKLLVENSHASTV